MSHRTWRGAPVRAARFWNPEIEVRKTPEGVIYVTQRHSLPDFPQRVTDRLVMYAKDRPGALFLADRQGGGGWRRLTYGEAYDRVRRLAQFLIGRGLSEDAPLAILSGNDIEHALLGLAAMHAGIPYASISPAYSLMGGDYGRLRETLGAITPGLIYVSDPVQFGPAIRTVAGATTVLSPDGAEGTLSLAEALRHIPTPEVDAAHAAVHAGTIAKFLFTSGSTGAPKAVINTHGMICSNQTMVREVFAYFQDEPPVILDWAPWHHTAGGNKVFYMVLFSGGCLYIDDGRPTPRDTAKTIRNLKEVSPNWYFNVPVGFDAIIAHMEQDEELREAFFRNMKMLWYAGASMAQHTWDALERLAVQTTGTRILLATGLGATETAPATLLCTSLQETAGNIGVPAPGVTLKLVPFEDKYDARVKGPNITPGYWRQPGLTAEAFDEEGFYRFGDALRPADGDDLSKGFFFDGRTAENFKLDTGTWVSTGEVRAAFINHFGGCVRDVAIAGPDRPFLGALVFVNEEDLRAAAGMPEGDLLSEDTVRAFLHTKLKALAGQSTGSSNRIERLLLAEEPPSHATGEITDKGSLNQRIVLRNRAHLVEELYAGSPRVISVR